MSWTPPFTWQNYPALTSPINASNLISYSNSLASYTDAQIALCAKLSTSLSGDLGGTWASPTVARINGVAVTGTPGVGMTTVATGASSAVWAFSGLRFNVKNQGAKGDGTTDDTAAILATRDLAIAAGGGTVWFPASSSYYKVSGGTSFTANGETLYAILRGASNVNWEGEGNDSAVIKVATVTTAGTRLLDFSGCQKVSVEGLTFDGNNATNLERLVNLEDVSGANRAKDKFVNVRNNNFRNLKRGSGEVSTYATVVSPARGFVNIENNTYTDCWKPINCEKPDATCRIIGNRISSPVNKIGAYGISLYGEGGEALPGSYPALVAENTISDVQEDYQGPGEVDLVKVGTGASAGTIICEWKWQKRTWKTPSIPYNATQAEVQTAFQAATSENGRTIPPGTVVATGGNFPTNTITLTWGGAMRGPFESLVVKPTSLTGGTATFTQSTQGTPFGIYGHGISIFNCENVRILNNDVSECLTSGIHIGDGSFGSIVEGNHTHNMIESGIYVELNIIKQDTTLSAGNRPNGCVVTGNTSHHNDGDGIAVSYSAAAIVTDNICHNNRYDGISCDSDYVTFSDNLCYNNNLLVGRTPAQLSGAIGGIRCYGKKCKFTGNTCYDNQPPLVVVPGASYSTESGTEVTSFDEFTAQTNDILIAQHSSVVGTAAPTTDPTITSNPSLTWTKIQIEDVRTSGAGKSVTAAWWARAPSRSEMKSFTVKMGTTQEAGGAEVIVSLVHGGKLTGSPIGANGKGHNAAAVNATYTSTGKASMGFLVNSDRNGGNTPVVNAATTELSKPNGVFGSTGKVTHWNVRESFPSTSIGQSITIGSSVAVASSVNNFIYFEILPENEGGKTQLYGIAVGNDEHLFVANRLENNATAALPSGLTTCKQPTMENLT